MELRNVKGETTTQLAQIVRMTGFVRDMIC